MTMRESSYGYRPERPRIVDRIAAWAGGLFVIDGLAHLWFADARASLTGLDMGAASIAIGIFWTIFGTVMMVGGLAHARSVAINAATSLTLASGGCLIMIALKSAGLLPLLIYSTMAMISFVVLVSLHFTERSDLKRELAIARSAMPKPTSTRPDGPRICHRRNETEENGK